MRIHRDRSSLSFRRSRRRRGGCLSWTVFISVCIGVLGLSWNWIGTRLQFGARPAQPETLADALAAFERGDLDQAIAVSRAILTREPNNMTALVLAARALIYRSYADYDHADDRLTALEITTESLSRDPRHDWRLAIHAYVLQANDDPAAAAEAAEESLRLNPTNTLARIAKSMAYSSVGSFQIGLREAQQAALDTQWRIESERALAFTYGKLADYDNAIAALERALRLHRHLNTLYFERALYALQIGDGDAATAAYYQILTYDPENVKVRMRLCELSGQMRERQAAIDYCAEVTDRAPEWWPGWYQMGIQYFLNGSFRQAQESFGQCSRLQVADGIPPAERQFECWYLQGQAAEILGDCRTLIALYTEFRAMAEDPAVRQTWTYPPEGPPNCAAAPAPTRMGAG
jgi:tetratricopeptide (TPR) repeat protein